MSVFGDVADGPLADEDALATAATGPKPVLEFVTSAAPPHADAVVAATETEAPADSGAPGAKEAASSAARRPALMAHVASAAHHLPATHPPAPAQVAATPLSPKPQLSAKQLEENKIIDAAAKLVKACVSGDLDWIVGSFGAAKGRFVDAKLSAPDSVQGWTPLYRSIFHRRFNVFVWLLERANIKVKNSDGATAMHAAADRGGMEYVKRLLEAGGGELRRMGTQGDRVLPLHYASLRGDPQVVSLMASGVDVDKRTADGTTAIYLAASAGSLSCVSALLDANASVAVAKKNGATALHAATFKGEVMIVRMLLSAGADANAKRGDLGNAPLHFVASQGTLPTMTTLIKGGCQLDIQNEAGATPLMLACQEGKHRAVSMLMSHGADVNLEAKDMCTPMHLAVHISSLETVQALLAPCPNSRVELNRFYKDATPLMMACQAGMTDIVSALCAGGAAPECRNDGQRTPLHLAVEANHIDVARVLLAHNADVTSVTDDGTSTLHFAAGTGNRELIMLVIRTGGDRAAVSLVGKTVKDFAPRVPTRSFLQRLDNYAALQSAARCGELPNMERGLGKPEYGADVVDPKYAQNCVDDRLGGTPTLLYAAAVHNHDVVVKFLIERGADVNIVMEDDTTALFSAAEAGASHVVKTLLGAGANPYAMSPDGLLPAYAAADKNKIKVLRHMNDAGVDLTVLYRGLAPLHVAAMKDIKDVAQFLCQETSHDPNVASANGSTPLLLAASRNSMVVLKVLLQSKRVDPNMPRDDGTTPLHVATQHGHYDAITWLLGHGAHINARRGTGGAPLHMAAQLPQPRVIELLLRSNADPNAVKADGTTALMVACKRGLEANVRALLSGGANPNRRRKGGGTALHSAVLHPSCVMFLLDAGADTEAKRDDGSTALSIAVSMGQVESIRVLLVRGTKLDAYVVPGYSAHESLLRLAAKEGSAAIVSLLLSNGLKPNISLFDGETSYDISQTPSVIALLSLRSNQRSVLPKQAPPRKSVSVAVPCAQPIEPPTPTPKPSAVGFSKPTYAPLELTTAVDDSVTAMTPMTSSSQVMSLLAAAKKRAPDETTQGAPHEMFGVRAPATVTVPPIAADVAAASAAMVARPVTAADSAAESGSVWDKQSDDTKDDTTMDDDKDDDKDDTKDDEDDSRGVRLVGSFKARNKMRPLLVAPAQETQRSGTWDSVEITGDLEVDLGAAYP